MYLTIYDLSGIQSFVFATNTLREIAGASKIVHDALYKNIPELVSKEEHTIYIGGGNALLRFTTKKESEEVTRKLQQKAFEQSGGSLRICSATIKANTQESLAKNQKSLMKSLDKNKRLAPPVSTARGFSINAHDNTTFEPLLLFGDKYNTKSSHLKRKAYTDHYGEFNEKGIYVDDFEEFRSPIEGAKNYLAVIHIDGNTMGIRIQRFIQDLAKAGKTFEEQLRALGELSEEINTTFNDVLEETVTDVFTKNESGKIPFRKVVYDGDDVTVICLAADAFKFIDVFMKKLSEHEIKSLNREKITAGAGMAIVNFKFPFYTAYNVAEELCGSAKKKAIALGYVGEKSKSSVDFHVLYGGATTDTKEFRKQNYQLPGYQLTLRPYVFDIEDDSENAMFAYTKFNEAYRDFFDKENKSIARGKLKGLRNAYSKGTDAVLEYGEMLKARHTKKDKEVAERLADSFMTFESLSESKDAQKLRGKYAKYFDVLDVLDFIAPAGEEDNDE